MSLVNVVCANYNQTDGLLNTIDSFSKQTYRNKRLIVIDGASGDDFLEKIRSYSHVIDFLSSEPDRGISDAFNKGVSQCQEGYVYFLGAGDLFVSDDAIEKLVMGQDYDKDWLVCGRIRRVDVVSKEVIGISARIQRFNKSSLLFRMSLPHQGLLTSTEFFSEFGLFREEFTYAMDYDLLLRAFQRFPNVVNKNILVADWMSGGIGENKTLEVLNEYNKIKHDNKVAPFFILRLINYWILLKFQIKRFLHECKN